MLNRIILIGRVATDPELKYTPSGIPVCTFRIAVNRPFKNQQGEYEADFIDIVAWRQQGEFAANYTSKGRLIAVEGRLQIRSYQTQTGERRRTSEVVVDHLRLLDPRPGSDAGAAAGHGGGPGGGVDEMQPFDDPFQDE